MAPPGSQLAGRIRGTIQHWFASRIQECFRCCECQKSVSPWDTHCATCGQENPARVSPSAPVVLVLAFLLLTLVCSTFVLTF